MVAKKIETRERRSTIDSHYHSGSGWEPGAWLAREVEERFLRCAGRLVRGRNEGERRRPTPVGMTVGKKTERTWEKTTRKKATARPTLQIEGGAPSVINRFVVKRENRSGWGTVIYLICSKREEWKGGAVP